MKHFLLLLLIAALALVGCSPKNAAEASRKEPQEVHISGLDELHYDPATVEVVAGRPVALTFSNDSHVDHDLSIVDIPLDGTVELHAEGEHEGEEHAEHEHEMTMDMDELTLHISAPPGEQETATFTPAEPGEYQFFCTVPGHRDAGMVGTLVVTAP